MNRRLLAAQLLWCGASSSWVEAFLIVLESAIHHKLYSLLHDVGWLGYGRYVLSARPQRQFVCNAAPEICSAHPTSGGPYYWAAMISKPQGAPFASWVTGWFNLLGQIAVTTGIGSAIASQSHTNFETDLRFSFSCADFISTAATIASNYEPNSCKTIGIFAAVLFAQGTAHVMCYLCS
jgi:hypothetical protein